MTQKQRWCRFLGAALLSTLLVAPASAESDADGCKDQYLSRMAGFYLAECEVKDYDAAVFSTSSSHEQQHTVEGQVLRQVYRVNDGVSAPSPLAVLRNYENALRKDGWSIIQSDGQTEVTARKKANGGELWGELQYNDGNQYTLLFAQPASLEQSVTTADQMMLALKDQGHVALDVQFDTGKATLRPEGRALVEQIAAMLRSNPSLKLSIEDHTDNVATPRATRPCRSRAPRPCRLRWWGWASRRDACLPWGSAGKSPWQTTRASKAGNAVVG
ncbi:MAG: OmpA/MotB domain protein [Myxococcaceae bacterium]|nr:OmpA/MotB domain protein [Myxococcaceae bacterium]